MKKLPNIDVLRFLLASLVVIGHIPLMSKVQGLPYFMNYPIFSKGAEAVYMFFTLSGFLIIRLIYKEKQNNKFSVRKFYIRRILRIFPLYYFVLIFGFAFYHFILPMLKIPFDYDYNLLDGALLSTFFLPNIFTKMYDTGAIHQVLWSLGIEEQFYLFIAPLCFFLNKNNILKALSILTLIYFVIYHLDIVWFLKEYSFVYFFLFFGGLISILEEKNRLNFLKSYKIVRISIVVLTFVFYTTDIFEFESKALRHIITCVLLGLFIHTISFNNFGIQIEHKALNYFGQISYGIYMYHIIILNGVLFLFLYIDKLNILNDFFTIILINIITFALTLIISHLSYKYFEKPFLKLKNKFRYDTYKIYFRN